MKAFLMVVMAVMAAVGANAQEQFAERPRTEKTQSVSLNIPFGASLHYACEHPLGRLTTVVGRVGMDAGAAWGTGVFGDWSYWLIAPSVDIEPRFYYRLDRRAASGRSTAGNAGSFLALQIKNIMPSGYISDRDMEIVGATLFTPMWGLRRVWGGNWLFEFTAGASFGWGWQGDFDGAPHLGVRFGYSF